MPSPHGAAGGTHPRVGHELEPLRLAGRNLLDVLLQARARVQLVTTARRTTLQGQFHELVDVVWDRARLAGVSRPPAWLLLLLRRELLRRSATEWGGRAQGGFELLWEMPGISREMVLVIQALIIIFTGALMHMTKDPLERMFIRMAKAKGGA